MLFERKPVLVVRGKVRRLKMGDKIFGSFESLAAHRAADSCSYGVISHPLNNTLLTPTMGFFMRENVFLDPARLGSREPSLTRLEVAFPGHCERSENL